MDFNTGEGGADFFSFNDAGGFALHIEEVVSKTITGKRKFSDSNALAGMDIGFFDILDLPAGLDKKLIYCFSGVFFAGHNLFKFLEYSAILKSCQLSYQE